MNTDELSDDNASGSSDEADEKNDLRNLDKTKIATEKAAGRNTCQEVDLETTCAKQSSASKENADVDREEEEKLHEDEEDEVFEDDDMDTLSICSTSLKGDQETSIGSASRTSSVAEPDKYQFELKPQHVVKSRLGRKVFKCDICLSVYRHAFSLKRHYIRSHINYNYITKGDMQNCQITAEGLETLAMATALQRKQKERALALGANEKVPDKMRQKFAPSQDSPKVESEKVDTEKVTVENPELMLSPGKDENRNKLIPEEEAKAPEQCVEDSQQPSQDGSELTSPSDNPRNKCADTETKQKRDNDSHVTTTTTDLKMLALSDEDVARAVSAIKCESAVVEKQSENANSEDAECTTPVLTEEKTEKSSEESSRNLISNPDSIQAEESKTEITSTTGKTTLHLTKQNWCVKFMSFKMKTQKR